MNEMRKAILYYAIKYQGDWNKIGQAIRSKESFQEIKILESYVTIVSTTSLSTMDHLLSR